MNWELIAQSAYAAYGRTTDFKNYQGLPMPKWEDLPENIQKAWVAAVTNAVYKAYKMGFCDVNPEG
jgi:hypothetical protein